MKLAIFLLSTIFAPACLACAQDSPPALPAPDSSTAAGWQSGPVPDPKLSNDIILHMLQAGISDNLILQTIAAQPADFELTPNTMINLRQQGVSNEVLSAMGAKMRRPLPRPVLPSTPSVDAVVPSAPSPVSEVGVYYKDVQGRWMQMASEFVHVKSGGFLKSTFTNNVIKQDRNGVVMGRQARLVLPRPIEFLIYTPDGVGGSEYDVLRFRLNSTSREFRALTGGVFHSTSGAQRDEVPFNPVKIAPRTYTFTVDQRTPGGEYGILPPGTGNITNGGKIFTFAITD